MSEITVTEHEIRPYFDMEGFMTLSQESRLADGERESGNQRHTSSGKGFFEIRCRQEGRCDYHHRSSTRETGQ